MAEQFLYLTTTGRRTGNPHRIEIWYVEHEGCYYLCAERREQSDWVQNLMHDASVAYYVAERGADVPAQSGTGHIVTDDATIAAVARAFDAKYGWSDGLFVRICT